MAGGSKKAPRGYSSKIRAGTMEGFDKATFLERVKQVARLRFVQASHKMYPNFVPPHKDPEALFRGYRVVTHIGEASSLVVGGVTALCVGR